MQRGVDILQCIYCRGYMAVKRGGGYIAEDTLQCREGVKGLSKTYASRWQPPTFALQILSPCLV